MNPKRKRDPIPPQPSIFRCVCCLFQGETILHSSIKNSVHFSYWLCSIFFPSSWPKQQVLQPIRQASRRGTHFVPPGSWWFQPINLDHLPQVEGKNITYLRVFETETTLVVVIFLEVFVSVFDLVSVFVFVPVRLLISGALGLACFGFVCLEGTHRPLPFGWKS